MFDTSPLEIGFDDARRAKLRGDSRAGLIQPRYRARNVLGCVGLLVVLAVLGSLGIVAVTVGSPEPPPGGRWDLPAVSLTLVWVLLIWGIVWVVRHRYPSDTALVQADFARRNELAVVPGLTARMLDFPRFNWFVLDIRAPVLRDPGPGPLDWAAQVRVVDPEANARQVPDQRAVHLGGALIRGLDAGDVIIRGATADPVVLERMFNDYRGPQPKVTTMGKPLTAAQSAVLEASILPVLGAIPGVHIVTEGGRYLLLGNFDWSQARSWHLLDDLMRAFNSPPR